MMDILWTGNKSYMLAKIQNSPVYMHENSSLIFRGFKERFLAQQNFASGGLAKSSEPIPFEYSCQVTLGVNKAMLSPRKQSKY